VPRFKEQALCIRQLDGSETSQVVVLLTEGRGKVRGLAKGAKRQSPSSVARFSGGIEPLTRGQVVGVTRAATELATLTEWDLQDDYRVFRTDLGAQRLGLYAADLCHALLADEDPHPGAFEAMRGLCEALSGHAEPGAALLRFQHALLCDAGYRPVLDRDAAAGGALPEGGPVGFDPVAGGLTARSAAGPAGPWRVRAQTVELLRAAEAGALSDHADAEALARANRLLCAYARAILDKELPTMRFVLGGGGSAADQESR